MGEKGFTDMQDERRLFAITRMWTYVPFLLPEDRAGHAALGRPGIGDHHFLEDFERPAPGENDTAVIHPATMSPLLVWACGRWSTSPRTSWQPIRSGNGLHCAFGRRAQRSQDRDACCGTGSGISGRPAADQYLAGLLNLSEGQIVQTARDHAHELEGLEFADGAPLQVAIAGAVDGQSWTEAVDFTQARPWPSTCRPPRW
ncbi:hypothetical protein ACFVZH_38380 [Streptomyces sp. NPDC059534]|uniref:hypothetical protein n=1 Tax=Streptomyces sp. NPDC059534 TaxID=3346859 RepID=UPI0036CC9FD5